MSFVDAKRWAMRAAVHPGTGKRLAYGLDFGPAEISKGKGRSRVCVNLFGVPVTLAPRGHGKPVKATETAHGHSFELTNPGVLTLEEHAELALPTGEIWRPDNGGLLKTTLLIDAKPARPRWEFDLGLLPGCKLRFQPSLSPLERDMGNSRPDWAVGSFAVYDPTGVKIAHIPRAFATDADGRWTWAVMDFDRATGLLGVEVTDLAWWSEARLPITIDPSMGYSSAGATSSSIAADYIRAYVIGGGSGVATAMWMYASAVTARATTLGLYTSVDGARVADSAGGNSPTTAAWFSQDLDIPLTLTNFARYLAADCHGGGALLAYYDTDADLNVLGGWAAAVSVHSSGALPAALPALTYGSAITQGWLWSIYAAVTAPVWPAAANVWFGSGAYGEASGTTPTKRASSITNCSAGNIKNTVPIDDVTGTYSGGTYTEGQANQYATDQAEVTSKADHLQNTQTICGIAGTLPATSVVSMEHSRVTCNDNVIDEASLNVTES